MKLVFVSSTFKDMQFERDMLQTYAIPTLNEQLREYGEKAYFGDLRWGVNTTDLDSDEGSRKVLKVCLDQIDNCKPYMIVLIGERYGWIPAQELIDEACVLKGIDKINDISVTELEIDYGALLNPEYEGRILFYFRNLDKTGMTDAERRDYEAESDVHLKKVEELKRRISEIYPDYIRYYDAAWDAEVQKVISLENFLSQVEVDLGEVLLRDLKAENNLPWQERSMQAAHRYFEEVNKTLVSTTNAEEVYKGSKTEDGYTFLYITGEDGSGKTAAVVNSYCTLDGEKLAFSCGLDKFSRDALDFERILIYKLEEMSGYPHKDYEDAQLDEVVLRLLTSSKEPLNIHVDNADRSFLKFLSRLEMCYHESKTSHEINASFTIAVQKDLPFYPFFAFSDKVVLHDLSAEDSGLVLDSIVKSNHKEVSDVVKARILSKENSCSAAYLKNIVKRLMILDSEDFAAIRAMGDGMDNINKYMLSIVDNTADNRYEILIELIEEAKDRINHLFVERLMDVFTHVPIGLSIDDIRGIFMAYGWEFNDLDFSLTVQVLEDVLHYNPYTRFYKIKNKSIANSLYQNDTVWDAVPAAEYMLRDEELCPYAFKATVLDATPEYLCSVLKRSEINDITDSIRYLVENGYHEKAIDLLVEIAKNEEFEYVKLLPSFREVDLAEYNLIYDFYCRLIDACDECLTKDTKLLLSMDLEAKFAIAEHVLDIDPKISINLLAQASSLLRDCELEFDENIANRMYFLLLKAVNKMKSIELFKHYIRGEEYLDIFTYDTEYEKTIFKMKVYTEFSEIVGVFDDDLGEKYHDLAYDLAVEADEFECKGEDFEYLSKLTENTDWLLLGKALYPFNLRLLRAEIELNLHDKQVDNADVMYKAKTLWNHTDSKPDCITYWRSILFYFSNLYDNDEEFDEEIIETYISLTKYLVEWGLVVSDYVDILHCASVLAYVDDIESLLEAAKCDGELETITQNLIRYYYVEEDMEKFLALMEEFNEIKDSYMGAERIAAISIEAYFEMLTEEE
ncbi:MAG: DUF4062 domain-containing protein [Ruminococcaceae bacterium]|nr:DUF4062 domain-containing protein [Oscillospiraceae bacterium]